MIFGGSRAIMTTIIRDDKDLERIREYIAMNPSRWETDDEFAWNMHVDPTHKEG